MNHARENLISTCTVTMTSNKGTEPLFVFHNAYLFANKDDIKIVIKTCKSIYDELSRYFPADYIVSLEKNLNISFPRETGMSLDVKQTTYTSRSSHLQINGNDDITIVLYFNSLSVKIENDCESYCIVNYPYKSITKLFRKETSEIQTIACNHVVTIAEDPLTEDTIIKCDNLDVSKKIVSLLELYTNEVCEIYEIVTPNAHTYQLPNFINRKSCRLQGELQYLMFEGRDDFGKFIDYHIENLSDEIRSYIYRFVRSRHLDYSYRFLQLYSILDRQKSKGKKIPFTEKLLRFEIDANKIYDPIVFREAEIRCVDKHKKGKQFVEDLTDIRNDITHGVNVSLIEQFLSKNQNIVYRMELATCIALLKTLEGKLVGFVQGFNHKSIYKETPKQ